MFYTGYQTGVIAPAYRRPQYKGPFTVLILGNWSDEVLCGQERCWDVKCFGMKSFGQMPLSI